LFYGRLLALVTSWDRSPKSAGHDGKTAVRIQIGADEARTVRPTVALSDAAKWRLSCPRLNMVSKAAPLGLWRGSP
jgi:hypothetical protein